MKQALRLDSVRARLTLFSVATLAAALIAVSGLIYVLLARALYSRIDDNLRAVVRREPPIVERLDPDGVPITVVQGQGWGSSLLLLPEVLEPFIGPEPMLLLAPVRNTLVAVPDAASTEFLEDLYLAIAGGAPDALDPRILRWTGRAVVDLADRSVGWAN